MRSARMRTGKGLATAVVVTFALTGVSRGENFCSRTAGALYDACKAGVISATS